MSLAFVPLYIKYLGMEAYGLIGIFAMLQTWLSLLDMGMKPALGREMARFSGGESDAQSIWDLLRSIEIISIAIAVLLAISVWAVSGWLATDWVKPENVSVNSIAQAFSLMGIVTALQFVESVYTSSITGLQRQVLQNVVMSAMATIRSMGALFVLIWVSPTIQAFFIWQGIVSLLTVFIFAWVVYNLLPTTERSARISITSIAKIWRYAAGMIGITFLSLLLTQVDKLLLSRLLPLESFGFYALACVVSGTLYALISPIAAAYYPRFVELLSKKDDEGLCRAYHQATQFVSVLMGSAAIVLMMNAELVIQLWVADFNIAKKVTPLVEVIALGILVNGVMWIPFQIQLAHGWTSLSFKIHIFSVLIIVPSILWLVPQFGAIAAAWIGVMLNAGYMIFGTHFMYRRILPTEKWKWLGEDVLIPLFVASVTTFLCQMLMHQIDGQINGLTIVLASSTLVLIVTAFSAPLVKMQITRVFI